MKFIWTICSWAGLYVVGKYQKFKEYKIDTFNANIDFNSIERLSPGVKADFNLFYKTYIALALTGSYQYQFNSTDMTSLQNRSDIIYSDKKVISNGETEGYLAPVNRKGSCRLSSSLPIFLNAFRNSQLCLIPYYYCLLGDLSGKISKKNHIGILLTIMPEKFYKFDLIGTAFNPQARYTFEQSFSIGYEFSDNGVEKHLLFLSGTLTFGKVRDSQTAALIEKN